MKAQGVLTILVVIFSPLAMPADAGLIKFHDGTFNDSEWSAQLGFVNAGIATFIGEQATSGGVPDQFRRTTHSWRGPGGLNVLHLKSNAIYDPSVSGAISAIDFSFDLNWLNAPAGPGGVGYSFLLFQSGTYYSAGYQLIPQNDWLTFGETALSASDFSRHEAVGTGGLNPDFSATGSPLQFGYLSSNGTSFIQSVTTISGIDNWSADVRSANAVPEPSTLLMFLMLAVGSCFRRCMSCVQLDLMRFP